MEARPRAHDDAQSTEAARSSGYSETVINGPELPGCRSLRLWRLPAPTFKLQALSRRFAGPSSSSRLRHTGKSIRAGGRASSGPSAGR